MGSTECEHGASMRHSGTSASHLRRWLEALQALEDLDAVASPIDMTLGRAY